MSWSVRGSNPRPSAHKTLTLPTELTDLNVSLRGRLLSFTPEGVVDYFTPDGVVTYYTRYNGMLFLSP